MRLALALLFALSASWVADAQVGSRGAVEVRREGDDMPEPPSEEPPVEERSESVVAETAETETETEAAPTPETPSQDDQETQPAQATEPAEATGPAAADRSRTPAQSERTPDARERAPEVQPTTVVVEREQPTVVVEREQERADPILDELTELVGLFGRERSAGNLLGLLLWFAFASVLAGGIRRVRERFPSEGVIPNLLALLHLGMRLVVMALALAFIVRALPPRLSLVMLLAFAGLAVAIGWSLRDVMPDLIASLVIAFERRIRRGVWVSGEGFAGHVERLGLRAALLYDTHGNRVMVPNREIVRAPVTAGVGEHARELEVEVRIDGPADDVRAALRDAVLTSPWVHPDARPVVLRDPGDPTRWRVRGRLLEASFGARFEGELLERAEALLRKHA